MKICIIGLNAYPLFRKDTKITGGGAEVQLYLLANALTKEKQYSIHFIVANYGQEKKEIYNDITIWRSLDFKRSILTQIICFFSVFQKCNADIYIQRSLSIFSGIIALYCKIIGKKFVYMVAHDSETDETLAIYKNKLQKYLCRLVFKNASIIIVQNIYEKEQLQKRYKHKSIEILKKGIDFSKIVYKSEKKYASVWIGRCEKWKNPEIFIELAEMNKELFFLCILVPALHENQYYNDIKNRIKLTSNITLIENIPNNRVYEYLSLSKTYCFTSDVEGDWPMVVLEATASGLPILSLKLEYSGLFETYNGGFNCENSLDVMNSKFQSLINDDNLLQKYSHNAKRFALENHEISVKAKELVTILSKL